MNPLRLSPNTLRILALTGAVAVLGACSSLTLGEQRKEESVPLQGNTASDYAILSCGELAVIETSARQRLSKLPASAENRAGQTVLLKAQVDEIVTNREDLGCPVPRSAQLAAETESTTILASAEPAEPVVIATPVQTQAATEGGRFLQIGTYGDAGNAQSAADHFADQGFRVETRLTAGGDQRVLVGPLATDQDVSRASNAARSFGVGDAFLTDG